MPMSFFIVPGYPQLGQGIVAASEPPAGAGGSWFPGSMAMNGEKITRKPGI